jgi:thiol-disulfide isomerase/thioredoxin
VIVWIFHLWAAEQLETKLTWLILSRGKPMQAAGLVVLLHAEWCGFCKGMAPAYSAFAARLASKHGL